MKSYVNVDNCYSLRSDHNVFPLVGNKATNGGTVKVNGSNLGCQSTPEECAKNFSNAGDASSIVIARDNPDLIISKYWANIYPDGNPSGGNGENDSEAQKEAQRKYLQGLIDDLKKAGMAGIDFIVKDSTPDGSNETNVVIVALLSLELTENADFLNMPQDFAVAGIQYQRAFTKTSEVCANIEKAKAAIADDSKSLPFSTTVLPFAMSASDIEGALFFRPKELVPNTDNDYWHIEIEPVQAIEAHTPYLVCPSSTNLTFKAGTIVKKTETSGVAKTTTFERNPTDPAGSWSFIGLYTKTSFNEDPENGLAYAFSGGKFVHIVTASSPILRAYILAPQGSDPEARKPSQMPGLRRAPSAGTSSADDSKPSQLLLKIVDPDVIAWIPVEFHGEGSGDSSSTEEGPLEIRKPLIFPVQRNSNGPRYDMKGRRMYHKPSAKGVYLDNKIPVTVK